MRIFPAYWFEGGKIRRRDAFTEREDALEAAGQSEQLLWTKRFAWKGALSRGLPVGTLPDELVGEEDEAVTNGLGIDEAHGLLVAGLAEEALAGPEHDWEDDQPQLVDQVMLDQRAPELIAGRDDDFSV